MFGKFVAVFFIFACFWISGLLLQKQNNSNRSSDFSIRSSGHWVRLLGLRPNIGRVYIRAAFVQIFGIVFLVIGSVIIFTYNDDLLKYLFKYIWIPIGVGGVIFFLMDIFPRKK